MRDEKGRAPANGINGKRQFYLTMIATLIALALIVVYTFGSFYSLARQDAVTIGQKSVAEQSERLNNFLLKGMEVLRVTALTVDYMLHDGASLEEIERLLRHESADYSERIDQNFTGIYGVFNGVYIDGSGWAPDDGYVPMDRPWYAAAVESAGEPAVVSPYVDAQTGRVMISVSQLLSDGESAVSLDIYMDEMQEFAQSIQLNGSGYGFIIDSAGLVVAHSDEGQKGKNYLTDADMQSTEMNALARQIIGGNGETVNIVIDGKDCAAFSQVVQEDWYVVMVIDHSDLFHKVEKNLMLDIIFALVIFSVVVYFCTDSYRNREKALRYAAELQDSQLTLEDRVREQTEEIRQQSEKMVRLQKSVVEGMATLIESRDGNTGEHVRNTKTYTSMIVRYMYQHGLHREEVTEKFADDITSAAVLHDVGKIYISDVILNKPGRFTPEEYSTMKTHASMGSVIVKDILGENADPDLVRVASDIAHYHHEKWDGSGYPEGLKGTEIPLSARIMAVADVFDALVSKRVYKEPVSIDETFRILQADAGSHFDPELIEIFTIIRPEVEAYLMEQ